MCLTAAAEHKRTVGEASSRLAAVRMPAARSCEEAVGSGMAAALAAVEFAAVRLATRFQ